MGWCRCLESIRCAQQHQMLPWCAADAIVISNLLCEAILVQAMRMTPLFHVSNAVILCCRFFWMCHGNFWRTKSQTKSNIVRGSRPRGSVGMASLLCRWQTAGGGSIPVDRTVPQIINGRRPKKKRLQHRGFSRGILQYWLLHNKVRHQSHGIFARRCVMAGLRPQEARSWRRNCPTTFCWEIQIQTNHSPTGSSNQQMLLGFNYRVSVNNFDRRTLLV